MAETTDDRQKEIEAWSKALARAEDLAIERKKEIQRLRTWLRYIEGNFRDGRECAAEALRGDAPPEGFTP